MKKIKRISFVLAFVMALSCCGITVYATDETQFPDTQIADGIVNEPVVVEFQISEEMSDTGYIAVPRAVDVDQTFTMTTSHRGADRSYSGSNLSYVISITDTNGNAVDNIVQVALHDYNNAGAIHTNEIDADGGANYYTVPITPNRVYYFRYTKISGTTRALRIHMIINSN